MKTSTILQIPITKKLRDKAKKAAVKQGFSSLQELVRVLIGQVAEEGIVVGFTGPTIRLSAKNAARYDKMIADVESGKEKLKTFHSVDELMADLQK